MPPSDIYQHGKLKLACILYIDGEGVWLAPKKIYHVQTMQQSSLVYNAQSVCYKVYCYPVKFGEKIPKYFPLLMGRSPLVYMRTLMEW